MSEVVKLCQNLVKFPTYNSQVDEALNFLKNYFEELNFHTEIMTFTNAKGQSVSNLYASYGKGHQHLLFCGHMDVVPAGDEKAWVEPPYSANIKNDILYGRGIADMKGGIACFADACREFIKNITFNGKISIIISGDEEEPLVDGTERVLETLKTRGEVFDFALVGEPSNPKTLGEEIKVGRRGDVILRITSIGKQGHTAYPHLTVNPIHNLVNLLATMQNQPLDEGNEFFGPSTLQVTTFDVGNPASNVVPAKATAQVDIRFNSNHNSQNIITWAKQKINETDGDFELKAEVIGESFLSPINSTIELFKSVINEQTGLDPEYSTAGGTSDARFVRNYCPVVEFGLINSTIHKTNECESIANIELLQNIYKEFLVRFFG